MKHIVKASSGQPDTAKQLFSTFGNRFNAAVLTGDPGALLFFWLVLVLQPTRDGLAIATLDAHAKAFVTMLRVLSCYGLQPGAYFRHLRRRVESAPREPGLFNWIREATLQLGIDVVGVDVGPHAPFPDPQTILLTWITEMLRLGPAQAEVLARHVELFTALGEESILASGETHVALSWMAAKRDNAAAADVAIVRRWFGEVADFLKWLGASTTLSAMTDHPRSR